MLRHLRAGVYRVSANRRAARCARRVHVFSRGLTAGARERARAPGMHDEPPRAACPLPVAAADPGGAALSARPRRGQLMVRDRQLGARARLRAPPRVREREPREGDAAHVLPARDRQPDAGRRRARGARADDHRLLERRRGHDLLPRRRRRAVPARQGRGHEELLRRRLLGERPLQRRGPGAALQPDRQADPAALARLRARPPVLDRLLPALGLLALRRRGGVQDVLQGRLARDRPGPARARGGAVRARGTRFSMAVLTDGNPSHEYGTETLQRGGAAGVRCAARTARTSRFSAARPQPAARASWTCTGTRRASA